MTTAVMVGTSLATQASVVACIAFVLLYEPACIAIAGGTVGHLIRIVHSSDLGRVSFLRAVCRTLVKGILGLWVFIAVYFTRRCQARQDLAAGTVVVPRNPALAPTTGFATEKPRRATTG